jgi:hypothetical protein
MINNGNSAGTNSPRHSDLWRAAVLFCIFWCVLFMVLSLQIYLTGYESSKTEGQTIIALILSIRIWFAIALFGWISLTLLRRQDSTLCMSLAAGFVCLLFIDDTLIYGGAFFEPELLLAKLIVYTRPILLIAITYCCNRRHNER